MNRSFVQQILSGMALVALLGASMFFLANALETPRAAESANRLIDIQLSTRLDPEAERSIYRVVIRTDRRAAYDILPPNDDSALLVRLPAVEAPRDLLRRPLSNALVRNVWIKPEADGLLIIRFDLASDHVQIRDHPESSGDWAIVIDLECASPAAPAFSDGLIT